MRTAPVSPSTSIRSPVRRTAVPRFVLITQGMPNSRATIAPWLSGPPMSITTAAAIDKIGDQLGSVTWHTRISPGWKSSSSSALAVSRTRQVPVILPPLTPRPETSVAVSVDRFRGVARGVFRLGSTGLLYVPKVSAAAPKTVLMRSCRLRMP